MYVDDFNMTGKKQNMVPMCKNMMKNVDLDDHFLITDVLNVNASRMKSLMRNTQKCLNHVFMLEQQKINGVGKTSRKNSRVVPRHERTCSKIR